MRSERTGVNIERYYMRQALRLARRGYGTTSPNPMVGAVLLKGDKVIGQGWHHRAGGPHAEIEALRQAQKRGRSARGATLYVTLEPCCTEGRTPPCTQAIVEAGITRVVAGATDPNPRHCGKAFQILERAGLAVAHGVLGEECAQLNEAFNHWITRGVPFVTVKAAMTLDGKIATAAGESKWITAEPSRAYGMELRQGADAVLVGINTVLADDPSLTFRPGRTPLPGPANSQTGVQSHRLRRLVLDARARTPLEAKVVSDTWAELTTIVASRLAPETRVAALSRQVKVLLAPCRDGKIDLRWLLNKLGAEEVTSLLVEGGGEVNASFLFQGLAQRIAFFYAPRILGGRDSRKAVAGKGAGRLEAMIQLTHLGWRRLGPDWLLSARVANR
jgi:diaminohydroxyphosphoribosylaminopyrimidine deaminase / 5-amino-6-(5-phosphoribosylamino)uracil reductase